MDAFDLFYRCSVDGHDDNDIYNDDKSENNVRNDNDDIYNNNSNGDDNKNSNNAISHQDNGDNNDDLMIMIKMIMK